MLRRRLVWAMWVAIVAPQYALAQASNNANNQIAEAHYRAGTAEYRAGHFDRAATEFRAAYELLHEPALLFNLGSALFDMGDFAAAQAAFTEYLRALPAAPNRPMVEGRLETIRQHLAGASSSASPSPALQSGAASSAPIAQVASSVSSSPSPARTARAQPSNGLPVAPIVVSVVGVVGLALSGVFYAVRSGPASSCSDQPEALYCPDEATANAVRTYNLATNISLIGGGVVLAGGLVWLLIDRVTGSSGRTHVDARLGSDGAALILRGTF